MALAPVTDRDHPCYECGLCDQCARCLDGQCCGADVQEANLPAEGSWPKPWPQGVEVGVVEQTESRLRCHCCGEWYANLGQHVRLAHRVDADTYRAMWGLLCGQPLVSAAIRAARSRTSTLAPRTTGPPLTPEQLSVVGRNRYTRSQDRKKNGQPFTREHQVAAAKARWAKPGASGRTILARRRKMADRPVIACSACGVEYCMVPGKSPVYSCPAPECRRAIKVRAAQRKAQESRGKS